MSSSAIDVIEEFMFADIDSCLENCVKTGYGNFVVALALSAYTKALGRLISGKNESKCNYKLFLERMGYMSDESEEYYERVRCGLVHEYSTKGASCVGNTETREDWRKKLA